VVSADEAIAAIAPGSHVFVGSACGTPRVLVRALQDRFVEHRGTQLIHHVTDGLTEGVPGGSSFDHRVFFLSRDVAELVPRGRVEYVPAALVDLPRLFASRQVRVDVALLQVSEPRDGEVSLGVSVDAALAAVEAAHLVIAEVNPAMPWTRGHSTLSVDRIDHLVRVEPEVITYTHPDIGAVGERIARYIARLIGDGVTLHIGFGRIPTAMLGYLGDRRDLGVHSDVITDPLVDLVEAGVVTGARKSADVGRVVTSLAMGSRRLYDLIDDNPAFEFRPIDEVQERLVGQERVVSVTQGFRIDLTGQVCADALGGRLYGGLAAQPEFHRAAAISPGGRAIVAIASRQPDGSPAFVGRLGPGEAVAVPRHDIRWVASEHGVAYLFGHSLRERAVALIELAHPEDREALLAEAVELGLVPAKQRLRSRLPYPAEEEVDVTLRDGTSVLVRPTRTGDAPLLQDLFYRLRPEDVRTRFFRTLHSLTRDDAEHLCSVGYETEMAIVAVVGEAESERMVASAQYFVDHSTGLADVAYMVDPEWHGRGLGGALHRLLCDYAIRHGVRGFTADVLEENIGMLTVFERGPGTLSRHLSSGIYELRLIF
jgi:acyl-CoA hydrolase/GNAT superfamily N-acetyltransferase